ncbi:hypothetical protein ALC57_18167, partial [Trachymyrmex cornetzi]
HPLNYGARTNESFRNEDDPEHHMGKSPLQNIMPAIDMVTTFILDYMHLACVCVMKKLLDMLMYGPLKIRLTRIKKATISRRLLPFENTLGKIKRTLRNSVKPLAQVCRREHERKIIKLKKQISLPSEIKIHEFKINNSTLHITKVTINFLILTIKTPNNVVLLNNGYVMKIKAIYGSEATASSISICGKIWKLKKKIYSFPKKSTIVEMWEIQSKSTDNLIYPLNYVQQKLIMMELALKPRRPKLFVCSFLHM